MFYRIEFWLCMKAHLFVHCWKWSPSHQLLMFLLLRNQLMMIIIHLPQEAWHSVSLLSNMFSFILTLFISLRICLPYCCGACRLSCVLPRHQKSGATRNLPQHGQVPLKIVASSVFTGKFSLMFFISWLKEGLSARYICRINLIKGDSEVQDKPTIIQRLHLLINQLADNSSLMFPFISS